MGTLIDRFLAYASVVLATLTALFNKIETLAGNISTLIAAAKAEVLVALNTQITTVNVAIATINQRITDLNFTTFGGRTSSQWETFVNNTIGTAIDSQEARIAAMKNVSEVKVVKLADFTGDIAFASIAPALVAGKATTHMLKFEAPLGATATTRNITGLPAQLNGSTTVSVDNGDELFISYTAAGVATIVGYNDNEAAVVASVLNVQVTQGTAIADTTNSLYALKVSFDAQAKLVGDLYFKVTGTYYYQNGAGIGTGQLG